MTENELCSFFQGFGEITYVNISRSEFGGFVAWAGAWALDVGGLIGVLEVSLGGWMGDGVLEV